MSATATTSHSITTSPTVPAPESRVKKTLLNARVNLIFYFLTLCLSFFSRKIFLDTLGADFVGLTGTLQNLLYFLNLAEMGVGSAIGFVLYKPLFDRNHKQICEIISVMGYLYRWIGVVIIVSGIILSFFLPLIYPVSDTGFSFLFIYFAYYSFLASYLIGYFINYRQNVLGADQKNYVVTAYYQGINIVKILLQLWLAWKTQSYYLWVTIELSFGIIYSFILNWKINRIYPWLKASYSLGKLSLKKYPEIIVKTKQLFIQLISSFIQFQTTPLFTYAFTSLQLVAYLGNYTLILDKLTALLNTLFSSVAAGVGNLIAEGNSSKITTIFWQLFALRIFIGGGILFVSFITFDSFISLWLGEEYILPVSVFYILALKFYCQFTSEVTLQFVYGYGLFGDVWASITQSIVFLLGALLGGYYYGLNGILCAALISIFLISGLWKPYYLFSNGFKISVVQYWIRWFYLNSLNAIAFFTAYHLIHLLGLNSPTTILHWAMCALFTTVIYGVCSFNIFLLLSKEARSLVSRFFLRREICTHL